MIYIVGAGWYGLYASEILDKYDLDYRIIEKEKDLFFRASGHNQNRLHRGFHYPRSKITRKLCLDGYSLFLKDYEFLTKEIEKNLYAIHDNSFIDAGTYESIYKNEGYEFLDFQENISVKNCEKIFSVNERFIDPRKSILFWKSKNKNIIFETKASYSGNDFYIDDKKISKKDLVIDCSWGEIFGHRKYFSENFISYVISLKDTFPFGAFTLMDGPFFSIFPYDLDNNLFSVTHVSLGKKTDILQKNIKEIESIWKEITKEIDDVLIGFSEISHLESYFISRKFKPISFSDSRNLSTNLQKKNILSIQSAKIDSIFFSENPIIKHLKLNNLI